MDLSDDEFAPPKRGSLKKDLQRKGRLVIGTYVCIGLAGCFAGRAARPGLAQNICYVVGAAGWMLAALFMMDIYHFRIRSINVFFPYS